MPRRQRDRVDNLSAKSKLAKQRASVRNRRKVSTIQLSQQQSSQDALPCCFCKGPVRVGGEECPALGEQIVRQFGNEQFAMHYYCLVVLLFVKYIFKVTNQGCQPWPDPAKKAIFGRKIFFGLFSGRIGRFGRKIFITKIKKKQI